MRNKVSAGLPSAGSQPRYWANTQQNTPTAPLEEPCAPAKSGHCSLLHYPLSSIGFLALALKEYVLPHRSFKPHLKTNSSEKSLFSKPPPFDIFRR